MDEITWERKAFAKSPVIIKSSRRDWKRIGIIFLIGVVLIAVAWRLSADIRLESEKRLKLEESITGALNKQNLAEVAFKERLKKEAEEREFNRFLYGSSVPPPEVIQQQIERNTRKLAEQNEEAQKEKENK
jgi:hypothetical protein